MERKWILSGKGPIIIKILRIIAALGWIAFFIYNLYLVKFLGNEYNKDPSNFIFFDDEQHRVEYKASLNYRSFAASGWVDDASLISQCRPMIYVNDFYFNRLAPIINWFYLLIVLTIAINIPFAEWINLNLKLKRLQKN